MNPKLRTIADQQGGWFARQDALAAGYSDHEIRMRMRSKVWLRLCRDLYVDTSHLRSGFDDPDEPEWSRTAKLYAVKAKALRHRAGRDYTISHHSAVVLHGLPTWGLDLGRVHLTSVPTNSPCDLCPRSSRRSSEPLPECASSPPHV